MKLNEFSDRLNITNPFQETLDSVSPGLKLDIWNEVILPFAAPGEAGYLKNQLFIKSFAYGFNISADQVRYRSHNEFVRYFRNLFFELKGIGFYNLINYISQKVKNYEYVKVDDIRCTFSQMVNLFLENHQSPCRFTENFALTIITDKIELESLNAAMNTSFEKVVNTPIEKAAKALYSGNAKDCCDEAYTAIEGLAKTKTGETKNDFSKIIDKLNIDGSLKKSINSGWGFVSNRARHGQNEEHYTHPTLPEAQFILVFASAVINFINMLNLPTTST
jgi:hypothetical protein